jgi:hypothetical protein
VTTQRGSETATADMSRRGVHLIDPSAIPWSLPAPRAGRDPQATRSSGVLEKWIVRPDADDDRFPVSFIRFPPEYVFENHWHTDGEFTMITRGSATVGDHEVRTGGMAYTDARTIYGAEAAGPEGCDFLMARRAWARNTVMKTAEDIARAEAEGIVNSLNQVAPTMSERGLHVLNVTDIEPATEPTTGLPIRWLMRPDPRSDRPPIGIVDMRSRDPVTWSRPNHGMVLVVLSGACSIEGQLVERGGIIQVDTGYSVTIVPVDQPIELLSILPIEPPHHQSA